MKHTLLLLAFGLLVTGTQAGPRHYSERIGRASWYGQECARKPMANGKRFDPAKETVASYAYPLGAILVVTNKANGLVIVVRVTDRGPNRRLGRLIDLSESAAMALDYREKGTTEVSVVMVSR